MNAKEWARASPEDRLMHMMRELQGPATDRKLRLYAVACVRRCWHLLIDDVTREGVEVAERFADGLATAGELEEASKAARKSGRAALRKVKGLKNRRIAQDASLAAGWAMDADAVKM
jgi:hypothetical protein